MKNKVTLLMKYKNGKILYLYVKFKKNSDFD